VKKRSDERRVVRESQPEPAPPLDAASSSPEDGRISELHATVASQLMAIRRREAAELRPHLGPAQQQRLDEHVVRIENRVRQMLELPPSP
jgi:hypothetical protein